MLLSKMIMNSLNFIDCSEVSFSHNLTIKSTTNNSRDFIFMNSIVSAMRESLIYRPTIAVILSLNNRQVSNVNDVISNFFI